MDHLHRRALDRNLPSQQTVVWVFTTLLILFVLLDVAAYTGSACLTHIAGYEGIFCALTAWYAAIILNDAFGRVVLPVGPLEQQPAPARVKAGAKATA